jgi:hypothetical protein
MEDRMRSARSNVLIVAHQGADSPQLIDAVARRSDRGPCTFTLLVPRRTRAPQLVRDLDDLGTEEAEARMTAALPLLSYAAGRSVVGMIGSHDPFATIKDAVNLLRFDEVMISMLPASISRWRSLDLPRRVRALGVPVIEVLAAETDATGVPAA